MKHSHQKEETQNTHSKKTKSMTKLQTRKDINKKGHQMPIKTNDTIRKHPSFPCFFCLCLQPQFRKENIDNNFCNKSTEIQVACQNMLYPETAKPKKALFSPFCQKLQELIRGLEGGHFLFELHHVWPFTALFSGVHFRSVTTKIGVSAILGQLQNLVKSTNLKS